MPFSNMGPSIVFIVLSCSSILTHHQFSETKPNQPMKTELSKTTAFNTAELILPADMSKAQWQVVHHQILAARNFARRWINQSRAFAEERWGADYVAAAETQMELALGLSSVERAPKPDINPCDKTKAIVTIEGIHQQFTMWNRKMETVIDSWDKPRLQKALGLVEPMERLAGRIRALLARC